MKWLRRILGVPLFAFGVLLAWFGILVALAGRFILGQSIDLYDLHRRVHEARTKMSLRKG